MLGNFGFEVRRNFDARSSRRYSQHDISLLFDIGANTGQFALATRRMGFEGKIVSFEPLSGAHNELLELAKGDSSWIVHDRCGLGAKAGFSEINISANSVSSSILPMEDSHLYAAIESAYVGKEKISIETIERIWGSYVSESDVIGMKIDAQGYESQILEGCGKHINDIQLLQLELSFVPLYEGQDLFFRLTPFLEDNGFTLIDLIPGFRNPKNGQLLQCDGIFSRNMNSGFVYNSRNSHL